MTPFCLGFDCNIQGTVFLLLACVVNLGGYEVVLGVQWLKTLCTIGWNFSKLFMKFWYEGSLCTIWGKGNSTTKIKEALLY